MKPKCFVCYAEKELYNINDKSSNIWVCRTHRAELLDLIVKNTPNETKWCVNCDREKDIELQVCDNCSSKLEIRKN